MQLTSISSMVPTDTGYPARIGLPHVINAKVLPGGAQLFMAGLSGWQAVAMPGT